MDVEAIAKGLTRAHQRLLLAMRERKPKKWRAVYRHAKVKHRTQLPFKLAQPTLVGSGVSTPLGLAVRNHLKGQQ